MLLSWPSATSLAAIWREIVKVGFVRRLGHLKLNRQSVGVANVMPSASRAVTDRPFFLATGVPANGSRTGTLLVQ